MRAADCCGGLDCRPTPVALRCCNPQGRACASSLECCGAMLCTGGRCVCQAEGQPCAESPDCCAGATCVQNVCRRATTCRLLGDPGCVANTDCCNNLLCAPVGGSGRRCCASAGTQCALPAPGDAGVRDAGTAANP